MFTNNSALVHHVQSKSWASFTDHNIVTITVNYSSETAEAQKQVDEDANRDLSIPEW